MPTDGTDRQAAAWLDEQACVLDNFRVRVERETTTESLPLADEVASKNPIYQSAKVRCAPSDDSQLRDYVAEWNRVLSHGPEIVVFCNTYENLELIDDVAGVSCSLERSSHHRSDLPLMARAMGRSCWQRYAIFRNKTIDMQPSFHKKAYRKRNFSYWI